MEIIAKSNEMLIIEKNIEFLVYTNYDGCKLTISEKEIGIPKNVNILKYINYFTENPERIKELKEIKGWANHSEMISKRVQEVILNNKPIKSIIKELNKIVEREYKKYKINSFLDTKLKYLSNNLEYVYYETGNNKIILVKYAGYTQAEIFMHLFIFGKDYLEIRKTQSYSTLYKIIEEGKIEAIKRLTPLTEKDFEYYKNNNITTFIYGLLSDYPKDIKKLKIFFSKLIL